MRETTLKVLEGRNYMAFRTFALDGCPNRVAMYDGPSQDIIEDPTPNDRDGHLELVAALLMGNAGLTKPQHGRILCRLDANVLESLRTEMGRQPHRFLALEIFLKASEYHIDPRLVTEDGVAETRNQTEGDPHSLARECLDNLRSLELTRALVGPDNVELFEMISDTQYDEIRAISLSLTKRDRIKFNDVLATDKDIDLDWSRIHSSPNALAILYNFSPYTDTGAVVASKRLRESGDQFDVVACSFANRKKIDATIERIAAPYVVTKTFLPMAPSWGTWNAFKGYAIRASRLATSNIASGRNYDYVYTRAMWAPSHYAGALIKREFPDLPWLAEFSDPLSLDVEGLPRGGEIPDDQFLHELLDEIEQEFGPIPESHRTIFSIAEIIAYARADRILFTNHHQQTTMLNHIYSEKLRGRVIDLAEVSNHPTLPSKFYEVEQVAYRVDPAVVNLAYFGEFYATRGLTEITMAIRMLPSNLRDKVHLHVFTNYIPEGSSGARPRGMPAKAYADLVERAISGVGAYGIEKQIHLNGSLPYLKFLGITKMFDYLLVNDAKSGAHHDVNPYLPSKWSDYAGSTASSWAFVEEGSSLAGKPATVMTQLGNVESIAEELHKIIDRKLGNSL